MPDPTPHVRAVEERTLPDGEVISPELADDPYAVARYIAGDRGEEVTDALWALGYSIVPTADLVPSPRPSGLSEERLSWVTEILTEIAGAREGVGTIGQASWKLSEVCVMAQGLLNRLSSQPTPGAEP